MSFALLFGKILESSIWIKESKETRLVWITILAMKDKDGRVLASVVGLADRAKVSEEECKTALRIFLAPDKDDTSKVEEGRRLRVIPGGWQVVNHELYRFSDDARRAIWREQKAHYRYEKKGGAGTAAERQYVKQVEEGEQKPAPPGPEPDLEMPTKPTETEKKDAKFFKRVHLRGNKDQP